MLVAAYAPVAPLVYGSLVHAAAVLGRPPGASALVYSSAAALTFDALVDNCLLFALAAHLALARFRRLPLPPRLHGIAGVFPKLAAAAARKPSAPSEGGGSQGPLVCVPGGAEGSKWRRVYSWRTGETHYEEEASGELLYPDGGAGAVLEATSVDGETVGRGVVLGPGFAVVADASEEFEELWGCKWTKNKAQLAEKAAAAAASSAEALLAQAFEERDFWLVVALHALAALTALFGSARAYHSLSALGATGALLAWRHLGHPPRE